MYTFIGINIRKVMNDVYPFEQRNIENVRLIYILYLIGLVFGITAIAGVVVAYSNKDDEMPDWLKSHYQYLVNTFWKGLIMILVGVLTIILIVGIFILIFWTVWIIVRCVNGIKYLDSKQPHPNPEGWWFD
jgi:uncharacterized membrane protein